MYTRSVSASQSDFICTWWKDVKHPPTRTARLQIIILMDRSSKCGIFRVKLRLRRASRGWLLDIVERKSRRRINLLLAFKRSFWRHYATGLGTSWDLSESGWFENISHVSNAAVFCLMRAQRIRWRRGQGLQFLFHFRCCYYMIGKLCNFSSEEMPPGKHDNMHCRCSMLLLLVLV